MRTIENLFGKSPFSLLESHMDKVVLCATSLKKIVDGVGDGLPQKELQNLLDELSQNEHEGDIIKNDLRTLVDSKNTIYQIAPEHLLDILALQDSIADQMEALGEVFLLRPISDWRNYKENYLALFTASLSVFNKVQNVISGELENLLNSTGAKRASSKESIREVARGEYEARAKKLVIQQQLFSQGEKLSPPAFKQWLMLVDNTIAIAIQSEKLADRIKGIL